MTCNLLTIVRAYNFYIPSSSITFVIFNRVHFLKLDNIISKILKYD